MGWLGGLVLQQGVLEKGVLEQGVFAQGWGWGGLVLEGGGKGVAVLVVVGDVLGEVFYLAAVLFYLFGYLGYLLTAFVYGMHCLGISLLNLVVSFF